MAVPWSVWVYSTVLISPSPTHHRLIHQATEHASVTRGHQASSHVPTQLVPVVEELQQLLQPPRERAGADATRAAHAVRMLGRIARGRSREVVRSHEGRGSDVTALILATRGHGNVSLKRRW